MFMSMSAAISAFIYREAHWPLRLAQKATAAGELQRAPQDQPGTAQAVNPQTSQG